ncbi:uncharacterized protein LOC111025231 [Momordica charantia]|uniref:Uncharacterized protein LOC111025231 n=1 Tax=Momordica charantia TaxID=3673 RepID=A0A6J1E0D0_MOMCH|nr:uncharacterized protein LOC111025231 [Momordica charantia]
MTEEREQVGPFVYPFPDGFELSNWSVLELSSFVNNKSNNTEIECDNDSKYELDTPIYNIESDEEKNDEPSAELLRMLEEEKMLGPHEELTETINLGSQAEAKEIKIGTHMSSESRKKLIELLHEYADVFAWSYQDMPEMPPPQTQKEVRGFLGRLNYIARFISHLTATCEPIFKLLRKNNDGVWSEDCQAAFNKIKQYLQDPPVLVPPTPGRPLILYLTVTEGSMGCVLGQHDDSGRKERAIYYLSKKFTDCETRYSQVEKTCCALAWATRRLRQYMLYYTTWLISKMDPIKYIFEKPSLLGRIARWQVLLSEYDIVYVTRKAIKGGALADYLAQQPINDYIPVKFDFPDEYISTITTSEESLDPQTWTMMFDGASNELGHGIGAILISPKGELYPLTARLCFDCTHNMAEYEA